MNVENIIIAFITGLTTGGLSCLAVQGGLLASSMADQIQQDFHAVQQKSSRRKGKTAPTRPRLGLSILAFLLAKLLAYTLLGFLLGFVGQMFQLSPYMSAFLLVAVGIFMLGTALRMLNVHPFFRYFAIEPPAFIRRRLRRTAAGADHSSLLSPALLGFLTVLIPCGITQAMMAAALGTGNPLQGAALMFAFTLGTSPVFFAAAYFTLHLGSRLEKQFMRFVAIVILILAVITIDSGISLAGSPVSLSRWAGSIFSRPPEAQADLAGLGAQVQGPDSASPLEEDEEGMVTVIVENYGYSPEIVYARAGIPVQLRLVSKDVYSCSRAFVIPSLGVQKLLDATGTVIIDIPPQEKGTKIPFSCSMGMYGGVIIFDL